MVTDQTAGRIRKEMFVQSYRAGPKLFVVLNFNRPWDSFRMHIYLMDFLFNLCDGTAIKEQGRSLSKQVHEQTLP